MVRQKPLGYNQIGQDFNTIQSNVSTFHPPGRTMLYAVKGLERDDGVWITPFSTLTHVNQLAKLEFLCRLYIKRTKTLVHF